MQAVRAFQASRPAVAARPAARVSVIAMAKPVKAKDMRAMSSEELVQKVADLKVQLASTRFLQRTRGIAEMKPGEQQQQPDPEKVPKGHINQGLRRQVAIALTLVRERQIAEGMSKRDARRAEKKAIAAAGASV